MRTRLPLAKPVPTLSGERIGQLLEPYFHAELEPRGQATLDAPAAQGNVDADFFGKLSMYLDLLLRWNARMNLTAIREPEEIVRRHFGESLFAGRVVAALGLSDGKLLDFGSGAGFPGLPVQLLLRNSQMTLAESQGKKAAFLRETVRTIGLATRVWEGRVEDLPADVTFDCVVMRAVDSPQVARVGARARVRQGGILLELRTGVPRQSFGQFRMPDSEDSFVTVERVS